MSDKIELHVERDGWDLSVIQKGDVIDFSVEYRMFAAREWKVEQYSIRKALLANLEEAIGIRPIQGGRRFVVSSMPVEWAVYIDEENNEYPYSIIVAWVTKESTFTQHNRGEICLTKNDVETLHNIFS